MVNNYLDVINKMRQSYKLKNPTSPENVKNKFNETISFEFSLSDFGRPENLEVTAINSIQFTLGWDSVFDAVKYQPQFSTDKDFIGRIFNDACAI